MVLPSWMCRRSRPVCVQLTDPLQVDEIQHRRLNMCTFRILVLVQGLHVWAAVGMRSSLYGYWCLWRLRRFGISSLSLHGLMVWGHIVLGYSKRLPLARLGLILSSLRFVLRQPLIVHPPVVWGEWRQVPWWSSLDILVRMRVSSHKVVTMGPHPRCPCS